MTPEATVAKLAEFVTVRREFSEKDVYAAMAVAGIPDAVAFRAFQFTQAAWSRVFLVATGILFSPDYICFNASGEVIESGRLEDEPHFAAASTMAKQHANSPGFQRLALMSADADMVNKALHTGSKAADLRGAKTGPAFIFLEVPTKAGMKKAMQVVAQHTAALREANPATKPWWKFWQTAQPVESRKPQPPAPDLQLMDFLKGMYAGHGAKAEGAGDWVIIDGGRLRTRAAHFNHNRHAQGLVLQTDFVSILASGERIVESFAGIGADEKEVLMDACKSFQDCTFHALFTALLGRRSDQAEVETWDIGGIARTVTFGSVRIRGKFPADSWPPIFASLEAQVKASGLSRGLHWVRYFYCRLPGEAPTIEVLLDNERWIQQQAKAAELPWPASDAFYSVRLFFIVQDR